MRVVANVVIDFGEGADTGHAILELDDKLNVQFFSDFDQWVYKVTGNLPRGMSKESIANFGPGDTIYFRLQYDASKFKVKQLSTTDGQISLVRHSDERKMSETFTWVKQDSENNSRAYMLNPIDNDEDVTCYGNEVILRKTSRTEIVSSKGTSYPSYPSNTKLNYISEFSIYKLIAPDVELGDNETWPVTIVAYLEAV